MTFDYLIQPDLRCIAVRFTGSVTAADVMVAIGKLWADPFYDRAFSGICDLSQATPNGTAEDVQKLVGFFQTPKISVGRWAIVTNDPRFTALGLLFKVSTGGKPWVEMFNSWECACSFLKVDLPADLFPRPR
jgi:hypothetical protein